MKGTVRQTGRVEILVSCLVALTLVVIAVGVFLKQTRFNPAVLVAQQAALLSPKKIATVSPLDMPVELAPLGAVETFNDENLFEKIDGKADLYLSVGFVGLHCKRLALKAQPDAWFEVFAYDMAKLSQAFCVYSQQRRAEAQPLDIAAYAYRTKNSIHFVCGRYYVEVVTATPTEPMWAAMLAFSRQFIRATGDASQRLSELALFPPENLVPNSHILYIAEAFGFDQLKNVFTAKYKAGNAEVTAFLTGCDDEAKAAALVEAYRKFLLENGGKALPAADAVELMNSVEIVFAKGNQVAGIHAAPNLEAAEAVARMFR
jgi:hypothetical protein